MHHFIPHFSGKFSSPSLESFLVYKGENMNPVDSLNPPVDTEKIGLVNKEIATLKQDLEHSKNIADKQSVESVLGEGTYEKYIQANTEMQVFLTENGPEMRELIQELNTREKDFVLAMQNNGGNKDLQKELSQAYARDSVDLLNRLKEIKQQGIENNESIWRTYFPESTGIESRMQSAQAIQKEVIRKKRKAEKAEIMSRVEGEYPNQEEGVEKYVQLRSQVVLKEYSKNSYLKTDPFHTIIEFVIAYENGDILPALTLEDRKLLKQIQSPSNKTRFEKSIASDVKRVQKLKTKKKEDTTDFKNRLEEKQADILLDPSTYQLAMINIAEEAEKIITADASHSEGGLIPSLSKDEEAFLEGILPQGYMVKDPHTDDYSGETPTSLGADKVDLENFLIYEGLGTWGILTTLANVMVAFQNGNWEQAVPYILAGGAATYMSADMVFNHTLDKMREPDRMAEWIFKEKNNADYQEFFEDPNEIDLWDNIQWPQTSEAERRMKKTLSGGAKIKDKYVDDILNTEEKEEVEYVEKTRNIDVTKTLTPEDFMKGGAFASYFPDQIEVGGMLVPKEIFLAKLKNSPEKNGLRYRMFKRTISRLGDKDSYLPHLHTLYDYAMKQKEKKNEQASVLASLIPAKRELYAKTCPKSPEHIATTGANTLKNQTA